MEFVINGRFLTQRVTGVQRYAREIVQALDTLLDAKHEIKITVMSPRLSKDPPAWRNITLREVGRLQGHLWEQTELPWYSRGETLFCPGNTAPLVSLLGGQPVIVTVHDLSYKYFPEAYRMAFRLWYAFITPLILRCAQSVITVSNSERRAIIANFPYVAPRLHAIANGGWPTGVTASIPDSSSQHQNYILYVGSFSKRKNFPGLLEVAGRLIRQRGFHFVLVGDTSKSLVQSLVDISADISSHITFVGAVDDPATLASYYQRAACFLFPSLYESSGLPPIEAMACGCPVVASDIPALKERCGNAAIYCDPHDTNSIAAAVEQVMDDDALRARLRLLGHERAAIYSWESCANQTLDLICRSIDITRTANHAA